MFSTSVLAESLIDYAGSCLFVSHDRTFISKVANKIWWIEDGVLREYPGTYEEYNEWVSTRKVEDMRLAKLDDGKKKVVATPVAQSAPSKDASPKSYSKNELKKVEDAMNAKEAEMLALAEEKMALEIQLHAPEVASDFNQVARITEQYDSVNAAHALVKAAYERLFESWMLMQES
jgi:ATP-binding cassette subfamily F protein 3